MTSLATVGSPSRIAFLTTWTTRVLGAACAAAICCLMVRAAVRLDVSWDTFSYHVPFAAIRGGDATNLFDAEPVEKAYIDDFCYFTPEGADTFLRLVGDFAVRRLAGSRPPRVE